MRNMFSFLFYFRHLLAILVLMDKLEPVQVKTGKVQVLLISSDASGSEGKL
jgi:hypothetical protein